MIAGDTSSTGANRGNRDRKENLCSLRFLPLNSSFLSKVVNVNSTSATATQSVADNPGSFRGSRASANKCARACLRRGRQAFAARKLRQERHVCSLEVERGLPSSVGAACGRVGWEGVACGSGLPLF